MHILLVEDNGAVRRSLQRMLIGHALRSAADADEAFELITESWPVDLVLTDAFGLGMDPDEFVRRLKTLLRCAVVVISAAGPIEGADGWLPKPFALDELHAIIQRVERGEPPCPPPQ